MEMIPDGVKRGPKPSRRFLYEETTTLMRPPRRKAGRKLKQSSLIISEKDGDVLTNGKPFLCSMCGSRHFLRNSSSNRITTYRRSVDPTTSEVSILCNACGIRRNRAIRKLSSTTGIKTLPAPPKSHPSSVVVQDLKLAKSEYLREGAEFGDKLVELVQDSCAKKFFCPKFVKKPCGCLQLFLKSKDLDDETVRRTQLLLRYHKRAKELQAETNESSLRSKSFEEFVLKNRDYLKNQLSLCEPAVQKILLYSNNFIFKRVKQQNKASRVPVRKPKNHEWFEVEVSDLDDFICCSKSSCFSLADISLLTKLRSDSESGNQKLVRDAISTLLTLSACKKFIQQITGCSLKLIERVAKKLNN